MQAQDRLNRLKRTLVSTRGEGFMPGKPITAVRTFAVMLIFAGLAACDVQIRVIGDGELGQQGAAQPTLLASSEQPKKSRVLFDPDSVALVFVNGAFDMTVTRDNLFDFRALGGEQIIAIAQAAPDERLLDIRGCPLGGINGTCIIQIVPTERLRQEPFVDQLLDVDFVFTDRAEDDVKGIYTSGTASLFGENYQVSLGVILDNDCWVFLAQNVNDPNDVLEIVITAGEGVDSDGVLIATTGFVRRINASTGAVLENRSFVGQNGNFTFAGFGTNFTTDQSEQGTLAVNRDTITGLAAAVEAFAGIFSIVQSVALGALVDHSVEITPEGVIRLLNEASELVCTSSVETTQQTFGMPLFVGSFGENCPQGFPQQLLMTVVSQDPNAPVNVALMGLKADPTEFASVPRIMLKAVVNQDPG